MAAEINSGTLYRKCLYIGNRIMGDSVKPRVKVVEGKYLWLAIGKGGFNMPLEEYYFRKFNRLRNGHLGYGYYFEGKRVKK